MRLPVISFLLPALLLVSGCASPKTPLPRVHRRAEPLALLPPDVDAPPGVLSLAVGAANGDVRHLYLVNRTLRPIRFNSHDPLLADRWAFSEGKLREELPPPWNVIRCGGGYFDAGVFLPAGAFIPIKTARPRSGTLGRVQYALRGWPHIKTPIIEDVFQPEWIRLRIFADALPNRTPEAIERMRRGLDLPFSDPEVRDAARGLANRVGNVCI